MRDGPDSERCLPLTFWVTVGDHVIVVGALGGGGSAISIKEDIEGPRIGDEVRLWCGGSTEVYCCRGEEGVEYAPEACWYPEALLGPSRSLRISRRSSSRADSRDILV